MIYLNREAFLYKQDNQLYISSVLEFGEINAIAKPLIYGDNKLGYQRKLDKKHYYELARKLVKGDVLLPTSIILGVDREFLSQYMVLDEINDIKSCQIPINELIGQEEKQFSVVDGQHRLAALELAVSKREELITYKLNVIILVNDRIRRNKEIKVFTDINSKAKKITTDLTLLAEYNYRLHYNNGELIEKDIIDHIGVKIAYNLNECSDITNVWLQAIKLDVASDDNYGVIGVAAFKNSLNKLIGTYIEQTNDMKQINEFTLEEIDSISNELTDLLLKSWNLIVTRWPSAFEFAENNQTHYNMEYYLQKTTGVNALHLILEKSLRENQENEKALIQFQSILNQSLVEAKDWKVKGKFAGLTSKSGFNKAIRIILNQEN